MAQISPNHAHDADGDCGGGDAKASATNSSELVGNRISVHNAKADEARVAPLPALKKNSDCSEDAKEKDDNDDDESKDKSNVKWGKVLKMHTPGGNKPGGNKPGGKMTVFKAVMAAQNAANFKGNVVRSKNERHSKVIRGSRIFQVGLAINNLRRKGNQKSVLNRNVFLKNLLIVWTGSILLSAPMMFVPMYPNLWIFTMSYYMYYKLLGTFAVASLARGKPPPPP